MKTRHHQEEWTDTVDMHSVVRDEARRVLSARQPTPPAGCIGACRQGRAPCPAQCRRPDYSDLNPAMGIAGALVVSIAAIALALHWWLG